MSFVVRKLEKGKYIKVSGEFDQPRGGYDFINLAVNQGIYKRNELELDGKQGRKFVNYQKALQELAQ